MEDIFGNEKNLKTKNMLQRIQKKVYKAVMFLWHYWRERRALAWAYESESLLTHLRLEHRTEPVSPQCKYIHTYIYLSALSYQSQVGGLADCETRCSSV